ncbi:MAG: MFS transporter [Thermoleophilia bacterium]
MAVDTILFTMVVPALPEFRDRFGFSDSTAALIFAAFPAGQLVTAFIAAGLVERAGRRPVMIMAGLALTLATLAFAAAETTPLLALARAAQGLAGGLVWTAGIAAISDTYPAGQLGFRIGLAETAGGGIGLLGPLIGGVLVDAVGLDATFLLAAILPALLLVPTLMVPETRRTRVDAPRLLPAFARLARVPAARAATAGLGLLAGVLALVEPLLPLDLTDRLDLGSVAVGLVFSTGMLMLFVASPLAGRWSDRHGRRAPLVLGPLLVAAGLPFMGSGPAWFVAVAFALVGVGLGCCSAPTGPLMVRAVDEAGMHGQYGLSSAVLTVVFSLGYLAGPVLGAGARAILPFTATLAIAAAIAVAVAAYTSRTLRPGG